MVAVHVLDESPLSDGRASALFAVLAGVSLVLLRRRTTIAGLAVRAVLIGLLGLCLGELETGIAIILTYYAVLFLLGLPFLALPTRVLYPLAAAWVVAGPVATHWLFDRVPERQYASPASDQLAQPARLAGELLVTGYYPAVTWLAYLLLGLAIGRSDLRSPWVQAALVYVGAPIALAAYVAGRAVEERTAAWWVGVEPHSGTPFDVAHTAGCAAAVIGVCLLAVGLVPQRPLAVLFGAGTMTLSLYSLHVVMRTGRVWPPEQPSTYGWHVLVLVLIGAAFVLARRRGPLESLLAVAARSLGSRP